MHLLKILNKLIISLIIIASIGMVMYFLYQLFTQNKVNRISSEAAILELNQGLDTLKELEKNPFLKYLPHSSNGYTIVYSSIKKSIVVIFDANIGSISTGRANYEKEINTYLSSIGATNNNISIKWDIAKDKNQ